MRTAGADRWARALALWAAGALLAATGLAGCVGPGLEPPARDDNFSPTQPRPGVPGGAGGAGGRSGSGGLAAGGNQGMPPTGGASGSHPETRSDGGAPVDMTDDDAGTR